MRAPSGIDRYLRGEALYGDDLSPEEIEEWMAGDRQDYEAKPTTHEAGYHNHALNRRHGFRHLPHDREWERVLSLGGGSGEELEPIASHVRRIDVVEPGDLFVKGEIHGVPAEYRKPGRLNELPYDDETFDLVLAFGVLHHIPNVTFVIGEVARCLVPGGYACLREPTVSMGDWRRSRQALTRRERGIPLGVFRRAVAQAGLETIAETRCGFAPLGKIGRIVRRRFPLYEMDSRPLVRLDAWLCKLFGWSTVYHAEHLLSQIRPTAVALVIRKPQ